MRLRTVVTADLSREDLMQIRALMDAAFHGEFTDDDVAHGLGGRHWLIEHEGRIVCHASVVIRELEVDGRPLRTGYLEAVATEPELQGRGLGTRVMQAVGKHIQDTFELGALSTGEPAFYERLGWERWLGPASVRMPDGTTRRTPDDDDGILVLLTLATRAIDLSGGITCEWRPGDVW
jgi:aminoglycoside 2'-N-acetyltransferase I